MIPSIKNKYAQLVIKTWIAISVVLCTANVLAAEYQYSYPVVGSTLEEVISQIGQNSESPNGAFGYTKLNTDISWKSIESHDGLCSIDSVNFTYDITIFMPEWIDKHLAKQCLQDNWDAVWNEVQLHEEEHRDIYRLLKIDGINKRISAIEPQTSCENLKARVQAEMKSIFATNDLLHDIFHDANTPPTLWGC